LEPALSLLNGPDLYVERKGERRGREEKERERGGGKEN
jgi:hypothetical protein